MDPAAEALAGVLAEIGVGPSPLVVGTADQGLFEALGACAAAPIVWTRRALPGHADATCWPPRGPFSAALVRMSKSKDELSFLLDAAAAVVPPGARIVVAGANDEGIRSAGSCLDVVADDVRTVVARRHCRVLSGARRALIEGFVGSLAGWRRVATIDLGAGLRTWVSYPGLFAGGRLDDGTRLLLGHLPAVRDGVRVLDFACGTGTVAAAILARQACARVTMLDNDALAVAAARENVPAAAAMLGDRVDATGAPFDLIVSNPPVHAGIA